MKAAQLIEPGHVVVTDLPAPRPAPNEILIRTEIAAICGSDLHAVFTGDIEPLTYPCPPGYPGHESVGTVIESRHPGFAIGDVVLSVPAAIDSRGFAEIQKLNPDNALPCPSDIDRAEILMAQQMGTVLFALKRFWSGAPGRTAAIFGSGPAGLHFLQLLKLRGFENVIVVDFSRARLRLAAQLGADLTISGDEVRPVEVIMDFTHGHGADLVVESAGSDLARVQAMEAVAQGGRVGLYGLPEGGGNAVFPYQNIFRRLASIEVSVGAQSEPGLSSFKSAIELISTGTVSVRPLISHMVSLQDIIHAFDLARTRKDDAIKICISLAH
jgi:L-iditol 2-dehydrogenase